MKPVKIRLVLKVVIISLPIASCVVGPDYKRPAAPCVPSYTGAKTELQSNTPFQFGQDIEVAWWHLFESDSINRLVAKGIENSPTVDVAKARLLKALESAKATHSEKYFPDVNAQFSAERQKFSAAVFGGGAGRDSLFNLFNANINVNYNLDPFGRSRREIESLCAQVDYENYQLEGTYLSLIANIVTTAISQASLTDQLKATDELLAAQTTQLELIKKQLALGAVALSNVLTQENLVATTTANRATLAKAQLEATHQLAALVGETPSEFEKKPIELDSLRHPSKLPLSIPSELVRKRPDIKAAEALIKQANANVGVATADFYPQINLTGSYGWQSNLFGDLFSSQANIWNMAGNILQPIFNGKRLVHRKREALAALQESQAFYQETVLTAFSQVANAIAAIDNDGKAYQAQLSAENASRKDLVLNTQQYQLGAIDYLTLLNAQRNFQNSKIARIAAQASRYQDIAALYQALGGGSCG